MLITERDKELLRDEQFDPRRMKVCCEEHMYFGPSKITDIKPVAGCKQCWLVYFLVDICSVPPSQRAERLQEMSECVHRLNEAVETGKWDYKPFKSPEVSIDKDALPD